MSADAVYALFQPFLLCWRFWRPYYVKGGGSPKGLVHNLLMRFFTPDSSKIEVFATYFFYIVTT